ncbi:uncharacterized protein LOC105175568 isoform X2 [Sesamum indicum]|uniref:Uncharacterized protein LOC105175568 isoform X2 n=1 Tax=Sesamum indicum TaxID=4182 RepID=A0A8M8V5T4_SESIN|nr:uncharacterized protein LOC105175568 isoform X2 [Sesamum indicum]
MVMELSSNMERLGNEIAHGWPLGLIGNSDSGIRVVIDTSHQAAPPQPRPRNHTSQLHRCSSFSSFSSSNLDTESTASFFPDQSVSLGRLIGLRTSNKGRLYCEQDQNDAVIRATAKTPIKPYLSQSNNCITLHISASAMASFAARSVLRSASRGATPRLSAVLKPRASPSPFRISSQKPLSARIFRSPVEMSSVSVVSMLPYHTATASAVLTSMLSVAPRSHAWTLEDCNDDV